MIIRAGYTISYDCPKPTPTILTLRVHPSRRADLLAPERLRFSPMLDASDYTDGFGNACTRLTAPAGRLTISTEFDMFDSGIPDVVPFDVAQHDIQELPDDVLVYLLSSRYVETDVLSNIAWDLFEGTQPSWTRVQAILNFVHRHIRFDYMQADNMRSAFGAYLQRVGVCRDFAHLAIAFCRCMNIPARYCTGYLGDIGMPPNDAPMDFSAWFEVYLGGKWHTADARHNTPRIGRVLMARGRDATDVALSTQFGPSTLAGFVVNTEEVEPTRRQFERTA
ncbi:transglutaminase family protein [Devosia sp. ZB163]|uniref:transglutaminase-like domain-containing protein n=1 Tax=Devosia sp. ZB163 TaxID=3025938 RepID=UPI00236011D8|nr:transglutaminase family protein [Devosia sp. ZB163]MDC9823292.1 transglutaminase family protein [Devosia sp. ZB163]